MTIPFLDLPAQHLALKQELMQVFSDALDSASFVGGSMVEAFEEDYAALVGATFTPDLFRCAVSIVGPSNLITFIQSTPPYWKNFLSTFYKRVGDPNSR